MPKIKITSGEISMEAEINQSPNRALDCRRLAFRRTGE